MNTPPAPDQSATPLLAEELRALFDLIPDGVALFDPRTTRAVRFNTAAHRQLGYSAEEFARLSIADYEAEQTPEQIRATIERLMQAGRVDFESRHRRKDGALLDVGVSLVATQVGGQVMFMSVRRDITEKKRGQQALQERAAELAHALELQQAAQRALVLSADRLDEAQRIARVGSWELDLVAGRLEWSDEIFRLFEIDKNKFGATYEAFLDAIHPDDRAAVNQAYSRSLETRRPYEIVHRLRMSDGRVKWVHERCTSDFDAQGKPLRSVGTVQDITEQRLLELELERLNQGLEDRIRARTAELQQAREEAERANQAKTEFLSRMSHELRTPMNAILGFGQLLQSDETHPLVPVQRESVDEILRAGRHLMDLINEILDLARVESGKLDVSLEAVELAPLVQDCLTLIRPLAAQRQLRLRTGIDACLLRADRLRLRQVLLNLLSNAVKYNRDGGEVRVRCAAGAAGRARIEVSDSGMGIAPDDLARLFRPFERLESAYKGIEGTGIGLALTRRLVQAMGGEVGVRSVVGEGSTFWVELPVASGAGAAPAGPATVPPPARRPLVLCIEDNPLNLRVMAQVFALRPGYELLTARSAEEGIDLARQRLPALILLDINLPGMDGYQALGVLKADAATARIPVVAVSANAMLGDRERGLASGFLSYVTKPIDVPRLLELLDRLLAAEPAGNVNKEMP